MDDSIRAATWQERAHAVSLQIVEENYYLDLWTKVRPERAVKWTDLTKAQALKPFQDLWELLPNSPAIRRPPFGQICSLAEEFCFGGDGDPNAAARTVDQTLANNLKAEVTVYPFPEAFDTDHPDYVAAQAAEAVYNDDHKEPTKILLRIDDKYADTVCKMGQGAACCRYLSMGGGGWSCLKHSDLKSYLDERVAKGTMNARGDNCEGRAE